MIKFLYALAVFLLLTLILLGCATYAHSQEAEESTRYAEKYLDSRTQDLDKYLGRSGKIQQRLICSGSRKV